MPADEPSPAPHGADDEPGPKPHGADDEPGPKPHGGDDEPGPKPHGGADDGGGADGPRADARLAGAIYGTILVMSVLAGASAVAQPSAAVTLIAAVVTSLVFWLAHVYSDALAAHIMLRTRRLRRAQLHDIAREEWPMVQSIVPPGACLLLGVFGIVSDEVAIWLAVGAGIVALAAWGVAVARHGGASMLGVVITGTINVAFGLAIVLLKILVH